MIAGLQSPRLTTWLPNPMIIEMCSAEIVTLYCSSLLRLRMSSLAVFLLVQYSLSELEDLEYPVHNI